MVKPHKEAKGLKRVFMPDQVDDITKAFRGAIALVIVTSWSIGTIAILLESVETSKPAVWTVLTAIVFLIIGRLWNIQMEKLMGE